MGNRGFTSSALARVASFRDRHGNPVFHVKPPTTAPSLDALTPASLQDHQDLTHYPVSNRDSPRSPEGKGTTPEFPITPNRASTSDAPANSPGPADASHESTTALP